MRITGPSAQPSIIPQPDFYTANQGETLKSIADKLGISESDLAKENNLAQDAQLNLGQQLHIPRPLQTSTAIQQGIAPKRDAFELAKAAELSTILNSSSMPAAQFPLNPSLDLNKTMEVLRFKAAFQSPQAAMGRTLKANNANDEAMAGAEKQKSLMEKEGMSLDAARAIQPGPNFLPSDLAANLIPQKLVIDSSTIGNIMKSITPPAIQNLAEITGKSPAELLALFKKYGLDPKNLPQPPNDQVAALFNDASFDSVLNSLKANVPVAYDHFKDEINKQASYANSINSSNVNSDTSVIDNLNTAPFKYLYDAKNDANTSEGQAWLQSKQMAADRSATLLSAMYPGNSVQTPSNGSYLEKGYLFFDNKMINPVPDSGTGTIQFVPQGSQGANFYPDYPYVDLITWQYDAEGDAAVSVPGWMKNAGYPTHAYDD